MKHSLFNIASVSRETLDQLHTYESLVAKWSPTINLISKGDIPHIWSRHIIDSLQLSAYIPRTATRITDIGSGGGFPGIVLACSTKLPFDLIESDARKCAFLREAARELGLNVTVHNIRLENSQTPPASVVTARGFAPLDRLIPQSLHLLAPNGYFLLPEGRNADNELTEAAKEWHMHVERYASISDSQAAILKLSDIRRYGE